MEVVFDYKGVRAAKSRLGLHFQRLVELLLVIIGAILLAFGAFLLVIKVPVGWLLVGCAAWPAMLVVWSRGELRTLRPEPGGKTVDALLDSSILAHLPKQPTPKDVSAALMQTADGVFFSARFGVTPNFLQDISSAEQSDMPSIWQDAMDVRSSLGYETLSAGMLIYAIIKQYPDYEAILAHNHLDVEDIKQGVIWKHNLDMLRREHSEMRQTGGIGRDWSFGYTPLLSRFGANLSDQVAGGGLINIELESHKEVLGQVISTFSARGRQNVALIGPIGVGKTAIVNAFAETLLDASSKLPSDLKFRQVVLLDASALIAAAPGRGQIEDLVSQVLGEAFAAKNIIVCLDNAQLFFEEGVGSVDISNLLLPIIEAGRLRLILTMDEQRYLQISQRNGALVNALNRVNIPAASKDETLLIMQHQLLVSEYTHGVTYTYQALEEAYTLSERYVHDLAMPGKALKLLESAASYHQNGLVTMNSVQSAVEQTVGVKISTASDDEEREKLLNLEDLIHERMINQTKAVSVVSDALRRARAGVRNPNRPIGTFLFLGPTGVGKTELAKALADVYFGGEDQIIRLDLNEYVRNEDVARLIADGANDPSSLTAQAMKQPFSVVLLDEIEKAHPNVLTTLLQLLDEGILRDINNREISFRDAIVIATSNAGADRIRDFIERGHSIEQVEQQFIDELINSNQFRPEFLNRFDEIVTFTPLGKPELLQVVDLMIKGVNKTLAAQKVTVVVEDAAKELLVEKGYDPRLGARPMRRVVQRAVENTVAKQMLAGEAGPGSEIIITAEQVAGIFGTAEQASAIEQEAKS